MLLRQPSLDPLKVLLPIWSMVQICQWYTASRWSWITILWWHHQMETFSALLAICAGNSPVTGEFPTQRPVTRSFEIFFDLRLHKRLSKQSWGWWFETPSCSLWRHRNDWDCLVTLWSSDPYVRAPRMFLQWRAISNRFKVLSLTQYKWGNVIKHIFNQIQRFILDIRDPVMHKKLIRVVLNKNPWE